MSTRAPGAREPGLRVAAVPPPRAGGHPPAVAPAGLRALCQRGGAAHLVPHDHHALRRDPCPGRASTWSAAQAIATWAHTRGRDVGVVAAAAAVGRQPAAAGEQQRLDGVADAAQVGRLDLRPCLQAPAAMNASMSSSVLHHSSATSSTGGVPFDTSPWRIAASSWGRSGPRARRRSRACSIRTENGAATPPRPSRGRRADRGPGSWPSTLPERSRRGRSGARAGVAGGEGSEARGSGRRSQRTYSREHLHRTRAELSATLLISPCGIASTCLRIILSALSRFRGSPVWANAGTGVSDRCRSRTRRVRPRPSSSRGLWATASSSAWLTP